MSNGVHFLLPGLYGFKPGNPGHITPRQFLGAMKFELDNAEPKLSNPYQGISLHPYVFRVRDPKHPGRPPQKPRNVDDTEQVTKEIQGVIAGVHKLDPSTPIWVTELGFPVISSEKKIPAVTEAEQAVLVRDSFSMFLRKKKRLNIDHALYYNIQDLAIGPQWWHHTGLLDAHRNPRPAWNAFIEIVEAE